MFVWWSKVFVIDKISKFIIFGPVEVLCKKAWSIWLFHKAASDILQGLDYKKYEHFVIFIDTFMETLWRGIVHFSPCLWLYILVPVFESVLNWQKCFSVFDKNDSSCITWTWFRDLKLNIYQITIISLGASNYFLS